ncbi:MAG: hypothetical protein AAFN50_12005 [Pseudomonadota bacterium]
MTDRRRLIHFIALLLAPLIVAWYGLSVPAALGLVLLLLVWRWMIVMSGFVAPEKVPELVLETISASHFVEKVRWCMDRLGVEYTEKPIGGTLGVFYRGRTVPELKARTGHVRSVIGNSPEILRYLWGRYGYSDPAAAEFLEPTNERVELERRLDKLGVSLQIWVYYRLLDERDLTLHVWGANSRDIPGWQRLMLKVLFPLQRAQIRSAFRISDESFARSVANIEAVLTDMNASLKDGQKSLLGGDQPNYTDFAFAAMTGLWLMPPGYGGGKAEAVRLERDRMPEPMRMDVEAWEAANPHAVKFVQQLYAEQRRA